MARAAPLSFRPPRPGGRRPTARGKGRGARSNQSGRYEKEGREAVDDGWTQGNETLAGDGAKALMTEVTIERPKKIITFNTSPDVGFDRSINPYRGCEHGCIYCFARPTHAYMGLSPGLDFESRLFAKPSAAKLLEKELSDPKYSPRVIAMGTNTDPYQPVERKFQIMRGVLSVFLRFNHPVTILTKSQLITHDIDLLSRLAEKSLTRAMISITTEDKSLARHMEPRAAAPEKRFETIKALADAGVPVGVMTAPMIPGLNDSEMESLLARAKCAGAQFAGYTVIRLPLEISTLFREWLESYAPARAARVMRHIRDMNGGKDYDRQYSRGGEIKGTYAKLIARRFRAATARLGLNGENKPLDLSHFRAPADASNQLSLF